MPRSILWALLVIGIFTAILFWAFPEVNITEDKQLRLVSLLLIGSYLLLALFQDRLKLSEMLRYALAWIGIGIILMTGYAYRYELIAMKDRFLAGVNPADGDGQGNDAVRFTAAPDGHFYVNATVNGVKIQFMVDTGASRVVINKRDAERLNLHPEDLSYTMQSSTANGTVWSAPVTLESITVDKHTLNDIPASVSQDDLNVSLLGVSYLEKLRGYTVEKGELTLRY